MSPRVQDFAPRTKPLPHQAEATQFVIDHPVCAIFDEQGLGKSKIVIDALASLMKSDVIDGALVVAPLTLLFNWEDEVKKHSHLVPVVVRGTIRQRKYQFLTGANFYIANYEAIVGGQEIFSKLLRSRRMAIALDEATRIKSPTTQSAASLHALGPLADRRVIMTGTPVANSPSDLWSQFLFLDGGELLGTDHAVFKSRYDDTGADFAAALSELSRLIDSKSIRRKKCDVLELPDKVFIDHSVALRGLQAEVYSRCANDLVVELRSMDGVSYAKDVDAILERLLRLVQIASNPVLLDPAYRGENAKIALLDGLLMELLDRHEKVLIWSSFVENVEMLADRYSDHGSRFIHGGTSLEDRAAIVRGFQGSDKPRVLVANPAAAREGLTLTRASAAVYFDRNFSLVDYLQSQDRIHRIGQEHRCEIHKLVGADTVDEYIDAVIELKSAIADYIYDPDSLVAESIVALLQEKTGLISLLGGKSE